MAMNDPKNTHPNHTLEQQSSTSTKTAMGLNTEDCNPEALLQHKDLNFRYDPANKTFTASVWLLSRSSQNVCDPQAAHITPGSRFGCDPLLNECQELI